MIAMGIKLLFIHGTMETNYTKAASTLAGMLKLG